MAGADGGICNKAFDWSSEEGLVFINHPTGQFRQAPTLTFETLPGNLPKSDIPIPPSRFHIKNPTIFPPVPLVAVSPSPGEKRWWYQSHCRACCNKIDSTLDEYQSSCTHTAEIEELLVDDIREEVLQSTEPVFGGDLKTACGSDGTKVPIVLQKCVELIEEWCTENPFEALSVYLISALPAETNQVKALFNSGKSDQVTRATHDIHAISGALKLYLLELPVPVIESESEIFKELLKVPVFNDVEGKEHWGGNVLEMALGMPIHHKTTMCYILCHLARLSRLIRLNQPAWTGSSRREYVEIKREQKYARDNFRKNIHLFAQLLMRPTWENIEKYDEHARSHCAILYQLVETNWGDSFPICAKARGLELLENITADKVCVNFKLQDSEWFWSGEEKKDIFTLDMLTNKEDGTFAVTLKNDYFILNVSVNNTPIQLTIVKYGAFYGIAPPAEWPTLAALITWHRGNALYIDSLKTSIFLRHPLRRYIRPNRPVLNTPTEAYRYADINRLLRLKKKQLAYLERLYQWMSLEEELTEIVMEALNGLLHVTNHHLVKVVEKPTTTEVTSNLLAEVVEEPPTTEVTSNLLAEVVEEPPTAEVTSNLLAEVVEEPPTAEVTSNLLAKVVEEPPTAEVTSNLLAKVVEEPPTAEVTSNLLAEVVEEPPTADDEPPTADEEPPTADEEEAQRIEQENMLRSRQKTIETYLVILQRKLAKLQSHNCMLRCEATVLKDDLTVYKGYEAAWANELNTNTDRKVSPNFVDFLTTVDLEKETLTSLSLHNTCVWTVNATPVSAWSHLKGKWDGSFLIYKTTTATPEQLATIDIPAQFKCIYCLVVLISQNVVQIPIFLDFCKTSNCQSDAHQHKGYTMSRNNLCPRFPTIVDLVVYFHTHSLTCYSMKYPTTLRYPVHWPIPVVAAITLNSELRNATV